MATKNLARTVIEAGRARYSKWRRRHSHAEARALARGHLRLDADFDELVIPRAERVYRGFRDKLGPLRRWLHSRLGRPWDLVRGEALERFDTRTTPGRHIVFCHLLPSVSEEGSRGFERAQFIADGRGILRLGPWKRFRYQREERLPAGLDPCGWLAERRVGARGPVLFWFTPTAAGAYRQAGRLSDEEVAYWRALPEWYRKQNEPGAPAPVRRN